MPEPVPDRTPARTSDGKFPDVWCGDGGEAAFPAGSHLERLDALMREVSDFADDSFQRARRAGENLELRAHFLHGATSLTQHYAKLLETFGKHCKALR